MPIEDKIEPIICRLDAPSEFIGSGTVFRDDEGTPVMHMHGSVGRNGKSVTGCIREGIIVWTVMEVIITELTGNCPVRKMDNRVGSKILEI